MTPRCRFQANHNTSPNEAWIFQRFTTLKSKICSSTDQITKSLTTNRAKFTLKTRQNRRSWADTIMMQIITTKRILLKYTKLSKTRELRSIPLGTFQRIIPRRVISLRTPRAWASCESIKYPERIKEVSFYSQLTPKATARRATSPWYRYTNWRCRRRMGMQKSPMVTMEDNSIIVLKILAQRRGTASNRGQESSQSSMNLQSQAWSNSLKIISRARSLTV